MCYRVNPSVARVNERFEQSENIASSTSRARTI